MRGLSFREFLEFDRGERFQVLPLSSILGKHAFERLLPNVGNERETFFFNQVSSSAHVTAAARGDFLLDNAITVEVGGSGKSSSQISDTPASYLALDNIEYGSGNRIPLWLFGFLY